MKSVFLTYSFISFGDFYPVAASNGFEASQKTISIHIGNTANEYFYSIPKPGIPPVFLAIYVGPFHNKKR